MKYDFLIKNIRVVRPNKTTVDSVDVAVENGKIAKVESNISVEELKNAQNVFDGKNYLAFPGLVDAHMHTGIYAPLGEDAVTESRAAAQGGVTSSLNYMRTGQYYLNKTGPYKEFFPEVLKVSEGKFHVDYAYHLAPIMYDHINEIEYLIENQGVTSFKIFMFYGSHGLHGKAGNQNDFSKTIVRLVALDTQPPTIAAALVNDAGASNSDGLTYDPRIAGTVTAPGSPAACAMRRRSLWSASLG